MTKKSKMGRLLLVVALSVSACGKSTGSVVRSYPTIPILVFQQFSKQTRGTILEWNPSNASVSLPRTPWVIMDSVPNPFATSWSGSVVVSSEHAKASKIASWEVPYHGPFSTPIASPFPGILYVDGPTLVALNASSHTRLSADLSKLPQIPLSGNGVAPLAIWSNHGSERVLLQYFAPSAANPQQFVGRLAVVGNHNIEPVTALSSRCILNLEEPQGVRVGSHAFVSESLGQVCEMNLQTGALQQWLPKVTSRVSGITKPTRLGDDMWLGSWDGTLLAMAEIIDDGHVHWDVWAFQGQSLIGYLSVVLDENVVSTYGLHKRRSYFLPGSFKEAILPSQNGK